MTWAIFLAKLAGLFKALLVPLAYYFGRLAGRNDAASQQNAENAELQEAYAEIATKGIDDAEVDRRLDEGSI